MESTVEPLVLSGSMDLVDSPYNYVPSTAIAIIFVVLYFISTICHVGQGLYYRMWWVFPTICLAGIMEVLGWSGRLWSSFSPSLTNPFQIQIVCTILAPTPLVAANFVVLGTLIKKLGPVYSRLTPRMYSIIFCTCDVIALTIQGVGGGIASAADTLPAANRGENIMLGGIVFQLAVITVYVLCAAEFFVRYIKDIPIVSRTANSQVNVASTKPIYSRGIMSGKSLLMLGALTLSTFCLYIRAVYRIIELSDGWNGVIISTQVYFNVFDGAMVVLAIYIMNFAHPGLLLGSDQAVLSSEVSAGSLELGTEETVMETITAERK
ncbi:RTA1-domain-containing protein [Desarmillaria tabescens]|uniref:RTA1-domain-containing protein n=1 Tax=Armillaria tabescens TaxID=1929756 RepID=A0AA39K374_ARMTA|nr:RTA1-domain-containing protein [Desarmillaria tabescens]KAK0451393.1 RTA1-domain-containing protein [Desarmillaria tabescens]